MKKIALSLAAAAGLLFAGCTSIESTQNFNGVACGTDNEKAACQTLIQIPGYYFFGLPIVTGGLGDGKTAFFTFTQTTDNAVWLMTKEVKSKGATRLINQHMSVTESYIPFPFVSKKILNFSATGVRSRAAAPRRPVENFIPEL